VSSSKDGDAVLGAAGGGRDCIFCLPCTPISLDTAKSQRGWPGMASRNFALNVIGRVNMPPQHCRDPWVASHIRAMRMTCLAINRPARSTTLPTQRHAPTRMGFQKISRNAKVGNRRYDWSVLLGSQNPCQAHRNSGEELLHDVDLREPHGTHVPHHCRVGGLQGLVESRTNLLAPAVRYDKVSE